MARYSDIRRADELKAALDKLELWQKKTRAEKQAAYQAQVTALGSKKANVGRQPAYINPFGQDGKVWFRGSIPADPPTPATPSEEAAAAEITAVITAVTGATKRALLATPQTANAQIHNGKKVPFAKVIYTTTGAGMSTKSRITDLPYYHVNTTSVSSSFGQASEADKEQAARTNLRTVLIGSATNKRVSFKPQGNIDVLIVGAAATP